ncbi:MAG TPA: UvrD-helicase domain-containing protein [Solirubrobacteraceae bacterium]|jgi:DNA helicase-2/ATP-dependent DNA helicase PcrA|nr:UvrD-helicase domain-containing protein [Solirubrobacteraceae bacterium]
MSESEHSSAAQALSEQQSAPWQAPPDEHPERVQALLEGLNEPQREAVTHGEGPLLILAGAGSGKTRVLTHRVAFLIFTGQAHPSEILAITFTNKAAQEMRGRVEQLLGSSMRRMWLMTFHAACARIMRAHAERLGYTSRFTIYDQADARRMVKRCIEEVGVDPKRFAPAAIHGQISQAKNKLLAASDCAQATGSPFEQVLAEVYQLYESELLRMNAMDFDDLLFRTVNLLELFQDVRTHYVQSFKHVLVDEYQDTNHAQYRLLQLLVGGGRTEPTRGERVNIPGHRNLAVVGDDSQSIYSFRGADVSNILDFEQDFPDARVVKLEQNYRSTQTILSAANAVIANNRGGIAKRLWSDKGQGGPIRVHGLDDEHAEARFVVGEAERLVDEGASRSEIAIFYRTNAMSRVIEDMLVRREIAYQVIGGTKFYERAEIKDIVAYLAWIANPFDVVSFQRVANSPRRGLGQTSLSRIVAHSASVGESVWEVAAAPERIPGLGAAAIKSLGRFMMTMKDLATLAGDGIPVGDMMDAVLARTGYVDALEAESVGRGEKAFEAQGRIENLQQLVEVAHEFDANNPAESDTLEQFLQEIALKADGDSRRDDEGLVTLMTLHNAKGLEYPIVFVAGCEEGVFPHQRALDEGGIEEERRLFYVAVTRAMRELYLTYARRRSVFGASTFGLASRFLDEIPAELCEREELPARAPGGMTRPHGVGIGAAVGAGAGGSASTGARGGGDWAAASRSAGPMASYRLGDDVVHAAFGEGVVTGVESGGIIVVRFAGDGSERKLMADYAPVSRR